MSRKFYDNSLVKSKSLEPNEIINVTLQIDNGELEEVGPSD